MTTFLNHLELSEIIINLLCPSGDSCKCAPLRDFTTSYLKIVTKTSLINQSDKDRICLTI